MSRVYALLIAIDEYEPPINPLAGCHNDIERAREFLRARTAGELCDEVLFDGDATRDSVVELLRTHLGRAGRDDVALLWFSGHGAEQIADERLWHLAPTGRNQTLVCVDSRHNRVPDLADSELSLLLDGVAARAGHTAVVLDCCHSGGGTRDPMVRVRGLSEVAAAPPLECMTLELQQRMRDGEADGGARPQHVALSACQSFEKAKERLIGFDVHGVFSHALLSALETLGPGATYRQVLAAARARVESLAGEQAPVLYPLDVGGIGDQPFLGGQVVRPPAGFVITHVPDGWRVDAGSCHGMQPPTNGDAVILEALVGGAPVGRLRVTEVESGNSTVEPLDWQPDLQRQYPVVVRSVPLPPGAVVLGGVEPDEQDDQAALARVRVAIEAGPSPYVRVISQAEGATGLRLRVSAVDRDGDPVLRILRGDGSPATADVRGHDDDSARIAVARLEHIARWNHIKELDNPASALAGAVAIEVVEAHAGEKTAPKQRPPLESDEHGEIRLAYTYDRAGWQPPRIFIRLRNASDRQLWCVLLDLTDRYRSHAKLFPGTYIAAGAVGAALEGRSVAVKLPEDRALKPGALVRDWFKVIASEAEFSSLAYDLPRLDEPPARSADRPRARATLDRLGLRATERDVGDEDEVASSGDWTTSIVGLVTSVPAS